MLLDPIDVQLAYVAKHYNALDLANTLFYPGEDALRAQTLSDNPQPILDRYGDTKEVRELIRASAFVFGKYGYEYEKLQSMGLTLAMMSPILEAGGAIMSLIHATVAVLPLVTMGEPIVAIAHWYHANMCVEALRFISGNQVDSEAKVSQDGSTVAQWTLGHASVRNAVTFRERWNRNFVQGNLITAIETNAFRTIVATQEKTVVHGNRGGILGGWKIPGVTQIAMNSSGNRVVLCEENKIHFRGFQWAGRRSYEFSALPDYLRMSSSGDELIVGFSQPEYSQQAQVFQFNTGRIIPYSYAHENMQIHRIQVTISGQKYGPDLVVDRTSQQLLFPYVPGRVKFYEIFASSDGKYFGLKAGGLVQLYAINGGAIERILRTNSRFRPKASIQTTDLKPAGASSR